MSLVAQSLDVFGEVWAGCGDGVSGLRTDHAASTASGSVPIAQSPWRARLGSEGNEGGTRTYWQVHAVNGHLRGPSVLTVAAIASPTDSHELLVRVMRPPSNG